LIGRRVVPHGHYDETVRVASGGAGPHERDLMAAMDALR